MSNIKAIPRPIRSAPIAKLIVQRSDFLPKTILFEYKKEVLNIFKKLTCKKEGGK
jgi:hypothetical protein